MSRLFSRLENMGHDHDEGAPSAPPEEPGRQADTHELAAAPAFPGARSDIPLPAATARPPTMPPLVPGYAIASALAMSLPSRPIAARPVWPTKIWLASLLLLLGLSLLILALPERLLPLAAQQAPAPSARPSTDGEPEAPASVAPAAAPPAAARPASPTVPSASAIVVPVPAAPAPRAETPSTAAAPPRRDEGAACSDAMLAMNLCSKSSP
jgi:hypothetical protein